MSGSPHQIGSSDASVYPRYSGIATFARLLRPFNPVQDVEPFAVQQVADAGDIVANSFNIDEAVARIEERVRAQGVDGTRLVIIDGDHTVALPLLRNVAPQHGSIAVLHFVAEGGDFRDWRPSHNIALTETIPVLLQSSKGGGDALRRLEPARWSLVPSWSKTLKLKYPTFNARSEDLASKATWKGPLKAHLALVPVSGYFEWQTFSDGKKIPNYIHNPDGELLMLAGLYSWWKDHTLADDDPNAWTLTTTILTSSAVDELLHIHDRNPVMLPPAWWDRWLDPEVEGTQELVDAAIVAALPVASALEVYEVAPLPFRGNGPHLIERVTKLEGTEDWLSTES